MSEIEQFHLHYPPPQLPPPNVIIQPFPPHALQPSSVFQILPKLAKMMQNDANDATNAPAVVPATCKAISPPTHDASQLATGSLAQRPNSKQIILFFQSSGKPAKCGDRLSTIISTASPAVTLSCPNSPRAKIPSPPPNPPPPPQPNLVRKNVYLVGRVRWEKLKG